MVTILGYFLSDWVNYVRLLSTLSDHLNLVLFRISMLGYKILNFGGSTHQLSNNFHSPCSYTSLGLHNTIFRYCLPGLSASANISVYTTLPSVTAEKGRIIPLAQPIPSKGGV